MAPRWGATPPPAPRPRHVLTLETRHEAPHRQLRRPGQGGGVRGIRVRTTPFPLMSNSPQAFGDRVAIGCVVSVFTVNQATSSDEFEPLNSRSCPHRAAYSHSASVGRRYPSRLRRTRRPGRPPLQTVDARTPGCSLRPRRQTPGAHSRHPHGPAGTFPSFTGHTEHSPNLLASGTLPRTPTAQHVTRSIQPLHLDGLADPKVAPLTSAEGR